MILQHFNCQFLLASQQPSYRNLFGLFVISLTFFIICSPKFPFLSNWCEGTAFLLEYVIWYWANFSKTRWTMGYKERWSNDKSYPHRFLSISCKQLHRRFTLWNIQFWKYERRQFVTYSLSLPLLTRPP